MSTLASNKISTLEYPTSTALPPLRFITCGNVDDGKSTLIGRLLWDTKVLMDDQKDAILDDATEYNEGLALPDFSRLLDGLQAEREQGITIDVAYRYFSTKKRSFIVADTPGHEQYTGNMATGASTADLAVILVDARAGIQEQTRRHTMIATLLGIKHLVLVINKMDLADYNQKHFAEISKEFHEFTKLLGIEAVTIIPVSAKKGENVTTSGATSMPWYQGETLLQTLEGAKCRDTQEEGFRLSVQSVSRPSEQFRGFQGTVSGGTIALGDEVTIFPSMEKAKITQIVTFNGDLESATIGDAVTLVLDRKIDISRGHLITSTQNPPMSSRQFRAKLVTLTNQGLAPDKRYWLKTGSRSQRVRVQPETIVNLKTQEWCEANTLAKNTISKVKLDFEESAFFDAYTTNKKTGAFIIIDPDTLNTVAGGMIIEAGQESAFSHKSLDNIVTILLPESLARELLKTDIISNNLDSIHVAQTTTVKAGQFLHEEHKLEVRQ